MRACRSHGTHGMCVNLMHTIPLSLCVFSSSAQSLAAIRLLQLRMGSIKKAAGPAQRAVRACAARAVSVPADVSRARTEEAALACISLRGRGECSCNLRGLPVAARGPRIRLVYIKESRLFRHELLGNGSPASPRPAPTARDRPTWPMRKCVAQQRRPAPPVAALRGRSHDRCRPARPCA